MDDLIRKQDAIDALIKWYGYEPADIGAFENIIEKLPSSNPESLTDKEQRIFLAAMGREEKVCKQVDDDCRNCREPYEDTLVSICHEIIRKVKDALWMT